MIKMLYTMLFPFMSQKLHLFGYAKEVFAIIFNFWRIEEKPVVASLSTMQKITGGTRTAVVNAVKELRERALIKEEKRPGKATYYTVTIDEQILTEFKQEYPRLQVKRHNQQGFSHTTRSSLVNELQKENKQKRNNAASLRVEKEVSIGSIHEM